jgi:phage recombination protein Bet
MARPAAANDEVAVFQKPRLPWHDAIADKYGDIGVTKSNWKSLVETCYPNAKNLDTVLLVLAWCQARKLDPFKKVAHIVPMWSSKEKRYVDTVWPSIAEIRITAHRTGDYAGIDRPVWGATITKTFKGPVKGKNGTTTVEKIISFPETCSITVYRMTQGVRCAYTAEVFWEEAFSEASYKSGVPNDMWEDRPFGQTSKCAEAAALRMAFPEEIGNEYAAEEMEGKHIVEATTIEPDSGATKALPPPPPPPAKKEAAKPKKEPPAEEKETPAEDRGKPDEPAGEPIDPDAYIEDFESQVRNCDDIDQLHELWRTHKKYDEDLPIDYRQRAHDCYDKASDGDFPPEDEE